MHSSRAMAKDTGIAERISAATLQSQLYAQEVLRLLVSFAFLNLEVDVFLTLSVKCFDITSISNFVSYYKWYDIFNSYGTQTVN